MKPLNEANQNQISSAIPILFEDEHLVAVAKPSGMFVHRSEADRSATKFLLQNVRDQLGRFVYPVHRLDRPTSGVMILAKSPEAAALLGKLFVERQIQKTYLAVVRGHTDDSGTLNRPLVSSKGLGKPDMNAHKVHQEAETGYRTVERFEVPFASGQHSSTRCALVEAHPKTGRFHQIRRHMAGISHPIIGDAEHGDTKLNRQFQHHAGVTRLMLAAVKIEFIHPVANTQISIECPPADSFAIVVDRLRQVGPHANGTD